MTAKKVERALYDSQSNGLAESAVKDVKYALRTNLACLVRRFGQEFAGGRPVLPWLVKCSAAMVNRCGRGPDGKTAHELRKGRKIRASTAAFAENILVMIPGVTKGVTRVEPRWEDGVSFGLIGATSSSWAQRGTHKVRTLRRREATERVDFAFLNAVSARPWMAPRVRKTCEVCCLM